MPGVDISVGRGTPLYAPCDGEIIAAQVSIPKGNVAVFEFTHEGINIGVEFCHLKELPLKGLYGEGDVMGYTGNTGKATTAPHCHIVGHLNCKVTKFYSDVSNAFNRGGQVEARNEINRKIKVGELINMDAYFKEHVDAK
jgi:murein DD-endopeptidase MepM/ murein hydrolase activator NlpD